MTMRESAHPRSRGENGAAAVVLRVGFGSSPLTRGKQLRDYRCACFPRLIPAHAGKTHAGQAHETSRRAHPRSRGENKPMDMLLRTPSGSSPLTRGKRSPAAIDSLRARLIPAHAGKTVWQCIPSPRQGAHPRSRGENRGIPASPCGSVGSSPLTRGKQSKVNWKEQR